MRNTIEEQLSTMSLPKTYRWTTIVTSLRHTGKEIKKDLSLDRKSDQI